MLKTIFDSIFSYFSDDVIKNVNVPSHKCLPYFDYIVASNRITLIDA